MLHKPGLASLELWSDAVEDVENVLGADPCSNPGRHQLRGQRVDAAEHAVGDQLQIRRSAQRADYAHVAECRQHGLRAIDGFGIAGHEDHGRAGGDGWDATKDRRFDECGSGTLESLCYLRVRLASGGAHVREHLVSRAFRRTARPEIRGADGGRVGQHRDHDFRITHCLRGRGPDLSYAHGLGPRSGAVPERNLMTLLGQPIRHRDTHLSRAEDRHPHRAIYDGALANRKECAA